MIWFNQNRRAFSKIELISLLLASICILSFAVPSFLRWRKYQKTYEAVRNLKIIFDAQQDLYQKQFKENPKSATFLTLPRTPPQPGPDRQLASFSQKPWEQLKTNLSASVYYAYEVEAQGFGGNATFKATARGDLDGDGHTSLYILRGSVDPNGNPIGRNLVMKLDPLE